MEGGDLRDVALEVAEVKVVGQRALASVEPHRLKQSLSTVLKIDKLLGNNREKRY